MLSRPDLSYCQCVQKGPEAWGFPFCSSTCLQLALLSSLGSRWAAALPWGAAWSLLLTAACGGQSQHSLALGGLSPWEYSALSRPALHLPRRLLVGAREVLPRVEVTVARGLSYLPPVGFVPPLSPASS